MDQFTQDYKETNTSLDRLGDRSLKTRRNQVRVIRIALIIIAIAFIVALQTQSLLQSYQTTYKQQSSKFYPLKGVPSYKIVFTTK